MKKPSKNILLRHPNMVLMGIALVFSVVFLGVEYGQLGDMEIYLDAAGDINQGIDIYAERYGNSGLFPYMGTPALAFILSLFLFLPEVMIVLLWKGLNILLIFRIWKLLSLHFDEFHLSSKVQSTWMLISFFSISFIWIRNFHLAQFSVFLLYSILEGIHQIRSKEFPWFGIFILALGIMAKILPVVAIPYLIYRRYWKPTLGIIIVTLLLSFLPALTIGLTDNIELHSKWLNAISVAKPTNLFGTENETTHGIDALIASLTIPGVGSAYVLDVKRNIFDIPPKNVLWIILIAKGVLIILSLYFLKIKTLFRKNDDKLKQLWELSYILMITPLVFPQQRIYSFLLAFPAVVFLSAGLVFNSEITKKWEWILFGFAVILINLELLFGHFRELYWHFKTLTYAVLILTILLFKISPQHLRSKTKKASHLSI